MFTGLVQSLATVGTVRDGLGGRRLRVTEPALAPSLQLGESVSVCGACLTVEWLTLWFGFPPEFGELLVPKGSVAIDGVSLTVVEALADRLSVMLIPHTRGHTTLGLKTPGDPVNLEFDLLAKHVQKLLGRG